MPPSRLTPIQERVLVVLAGASPGWVLTGESALGGFHTRQRSTPDLDLFWRSRSEIQGARGPVLAALEAAKLQAEVLQSSPACLRLRVTDRGESVVVDLVADPVAAIEPAMSVTLDAVVLRVDTRHEILVNKLCALVQRSELRDLIDTLALLEGGCDLERGLKDAPRKDAGFSPLTLAWLLGELPVAALARASGETPESAARLETKRDELVRQVAKLTRGQP